MTVVNACSVLVAYIKLSFKGPYKGLIADLIGPISQGLAAQQGLVASYKGWHLFIPYKRSVTC